MCGTSSEAGELGPVHMWTGGRVSTDPSPKASSVRFKVEALQQSPLSIFGSTYCR